jgi:hypothetical protein
VTSSKQCETGTGVFKLAVLWCQWTPQIKTRIVRDVLSLQRLATVNQTQLVVACDAELHPQLEALRVGVSSDFNGSDMWRVYAVSQELLTDETMSRIPDDVTDVENIFLIGGRPPLPTIKDQHPYDAMDLKKDWYSIPDTMPLDQPAPLNQEPDYYSINPFL